MLRKGRSRNGKTRQWGQFGVRGQFGVSSSLLLPLAIKSVSWIHGRLPRPTGDDLIYHAINRGQDNSVSVHHYKDNSVSVVYAALRHPE